MIFAILCVRAPDEIADIRGCARLSIKNNFKPGGSSEGNHVRQCSLVGSLRASRVLFSAVSLRRNIETSRVPLDGMYQAEQLPLISYLSELAANRT